jgi:hypothetical protein
VHIVSHEKNRQLMMGPALAFNKPFLEEQLPAYIQSMEKRAADAPNLKPLLEADKAFFEQKKNVHLVLPNVTFSAGRESGKGEGAGSGSGEGGHLSRAARSDGDDHRRPAAAQ